MPEPAPLQLTRAPLMLDDEEGLAQLREGLHAAGYTESGVRQALGVEVFSSAGWRLDTPLYLRRLASPTPLHTLLKLFLLGATVFEHEASAAIVPFELERLAAMGLVERCAEGIRPLVGLTAYAGLILAHDRYDRDSAPLQPDHVLDVNPTSLMLCNITVRRAARSVLDVGTGCGIQALLAAPHADHVVAVDTNPRALNFAQFNARLNGAGHVEYRQGSLFEPVAGRQFDLIVCNPPYVISPESRYEFRDSGLPRDAISQEVVRQAPHHLAPGGFACILCNWIHRKEEDWSLPLRRWIEGSGCDAWLLHYDTQDPLTYAAVWNRQNDGRAYADGLDRWVRYDEEVGIEAISLGAVLLQRREGGRNWVRADTFPGPRMNPCGDHILRIFKAEDYLSGGMTDEALLDQAFRLVDDHRLEQWLAFRDGNYAVEDMQLRLVGGFEFRGTVDAYTLHLLSQCNGERRLGDLLDELARMMGGGREKLVVAIPGIVRQLVALGFLLPMA